MSTMWRCTLTGLSRSGTGWWRAIRLSEMKLWLRAGWGVSMATLEMDRRLPGVQRKEVELDDLETGGISLLESMGLAWSTLMSNKIRTVLTALGVIIGVASV